MQTSNRQEAFFSLDSLYELDTFTLYDFLSLLDELRTYVAGMKFTYEKNEAPDSYTLVYNRKPCAEILLNEEGAKELIEFMNFTISKELLLSEDILFPEVKNDGDKLGIIVDFWDIKYEECVSSALFLFDDFKFAD
jgi:hypothetical protein